MNRHHQETQKALQMIFHSLQQWKKEWEEHSKHQHQIQNAIMSKLQELTDTVATLGQTTSDVVASVDAAVTDIQNLGPTDAQLGTLTDSLNAINATLASQAKRLDAAVKTPAPAPTPEPPSPV